MKIKDICEYGAKSKMNAGRGLSEGSYPFYTSSAVCNKYLDYAQFLEPGIIMGTGGNTTLHYCSGNFSVSTDCLVLFPKRNIETKYLYYFFKSNIHVLDAGFKGAGLKHTSKTYINEIEIKKIPQRLEQLKVVKILDSVQEIINKKEEQLLQLDALIKSRFVEMFGDPVQNPMGWEMSLVEDAVACDKNALKAGPFGSSLKKEYYVESGYKIYGQEQVIGGDHTIGNYYIDEKRYKSLESCAVNAGDVLISLVGTYGKLLIMPEKFEPGIINPRLMKITFDKKKVNPYYFQYLFQSESLKNKLSSKTHGGTMDILNLGIVRKIALPLPPLELQNRFVLFVEHIDKLKFSVQKSLEETQLLFDSLMQEYFG